MDSGFRLGEEGSQVVLMHTGCINLSMMITTAAATTKNKNKHNNNHHNHTVNDSDNHKYISNRLEG